MILPSLPGIIHREKSRAGTHVSGSFNIQLKLDSDLSLFEAVGVFVIFLHLFGAVFGAGAAGENIYLDLVSLFGLRNVFV